MNTMLMDTLREAVMQTVNAEKPADFLYGVVESESPLVIRIDQQETVTSEFLVLTDLVRDYSVDITVNHTTENSAGGSGDAEFASHNHGYKGRKRITVHNGLHAGEKVIMMRQAGGQEYLVLSRVFDHQGLSGQWG